MFDKNEELITVVDPEYLLESEQTQELNGLITTIVSAPYSKELESAFYIGSRDIDDNNIFWLYKVDKRTKEKNNIVLNGTYSLFDDLKAYDVIRDKRPSNTSALVGINTVLEGSRWQVGNITSTHTGTANWYYVSRLEAFWEYLENWNVEFKPRMTFSKGKITGRYIDIVDKLSNDYGKWYEYGDKLLQVTAEQASDSLYTAFVGRGKGEESGDGYGRRIGFEKIVWTTASGNPVNKPLNQDYVEIPSATELYGYSDGKPRMTVVIFEDIEDSVQLIQQTYDYALNECRPKLQLKANVLEEGVSELGETCTIIRDDRGIRYKTRVFKLTRNFLNKKQRTAEFGDEIVQSTAQRNSNTAKVIKKQEQQFIAWMDALQQELLDSYFNEDGYNYDLKAGNEYDLPGGFYSFNAPIDQNPTKLIYMGAGSLAIANSKNPDGSWNFRTWGTGDGFTADLINAGIMRGAFMEHNLNVGESVYTNPLTGETLRFKQGEIIFSKDGQTRYLRYNAEGLKSVAGANNTGTSRNSSFHLEGSGTGSVQYLQSSAGNGIQQRLEFEDIKARVLVGAEGAFEVMEYLSKMYAPILASRFETRHASGARLIMAGNSLSTPRDGNRDMFLAPNGNGSVVAGDAEGLRWNMVASDFVKQSTRDSKTDINPLISKGMDVINRLSPVSYKKIDKLARGIDEVEIGFIAEDSLEVATDDGQGIYDSHITAYLVKALQEKDVEIQTMKQELQDIKEQLGLS